MAIGLLIISAVIGGVGLYPYIRHTLSGRVRPRLVTWGVWSLLGAIMTIAGLLSHNWASAVLSAQGLVGCGLVVGFGWNRGNAAISRMDTICLIGAIFGVAALVFLRDPTVALLLAIAVDATAFLPTLVHAWTDPDEETKTAYACNIAASGLAAIVALMAHDGLAGLAYPIYSVAFNALMVALLLSDDFDFPSFSGDFQPQEADA